jgi:hypothetical protein
MNTHGEGGRGAGFKEVVLVPLLSKGGKGINDREDPGAREWPKKTRNGSSDL